MTGVDAHSESGLHSPQKPAGHALLCRSSEQWHGRENDTGYNQSDS